MTGTALVTEARKWIGTPFFWNGRNENGLDCAGLILLTAKAVGIELPEPPNYGPQTAVAALHVALWAHCERVDLGWGVAGYRNPDAYVQPGDLGLFAIHRLPQHVGIFTGEGSLVHVHQAAKRTREERVEGWADRLVSVWRLKGLCDGAR